MRKPLLGIAVRQLVLVGLVLAFTAAEADARRRHYHRYVYRVERIAPIPESYVRGSVERRGLVRRGAERDMRALIPPDWRLEPPNPDWEGHRFVSPRGDAWLEIYGRPTNQEPREQYLKTMAFGEGEELTYLRGERNWIAVSGFKGDRIFYRKAVLACGERQWRHIVFEYPAEARRVLNQFVSAMSLGLDRSVNQNCDATVGRRD
jgi:hypothetical protein